MLPGVGGAADTGAVEYDGPDGLLVLQTHGHVVGGKAPEVAGPQRGLELQVQDGVVGQAEELVGMLRPYLELRELRGQGVDNGRQGHAKAREEVAAQSSRDELEDDIGTLARHAGLTHMRPSSMMTIHSTVG